MAYRMKHFVTKNLRINAALGLENITRMLDFFFAGFRNVENYFNIVLLCFCSRKNIILTTRVCPATLFRLMCFLDQIVLD